MQRERIHVGLGGNVDFAAYDDLTALFERLHWLLAPIRCDAREVTFADSSGVEPIAAASRRRAADHRPPLQIAHPSRTMTRALQLSEVEYLIDPAPSRADLVRPSVSHYPFRG